MKNLKTTANLIRKKLGEHGKAKLNGFEILEGTSNTNLMIAKDGHGTVYCNTVEEAVKAIMKRANPCEACGEKLLDEKTVWLELSQTDGKYYKPNDLPQGHISQGSFPFGKACATKVLLTGSGE